MQLTSQSRHCPSLMQRAANRLVLVCFALAAQATLSAADQELPNEVAWNDSRIRYVGRFDFSDKAGPRCAWTASGIRVRLHGSSLNIRIKEGGDNRWQAIIDGVPGAVIAPMKGAAEVYSVAKDLPPGEHDIEIYKRTEPLVGESQILGLQIDEHAKLLDVPRPTMRIEVIGDSISCGYGNEGKSEKEHFSAATENGLMAYGAIAARALNAEYVCIGWSGRKLWPNNTMVEVFERILPQNPTSAWNFAAWKPDVVVINLGTNDFGPGNPDEEKWIQAYVKFVKRVRELYPDARILCASGSMMSDYWPPERKALSTINRYLAKIVDSFHEAHDKRVQVIHFSPQDKNKDGIGSDWHPNIATHRKMADVLVKAIKEGAIQ